MYLISTVSPARFEPNRPPFYSPSGRVSRILCASVVALLGLTTAMAHASAGEVPKQARIIGGQATAPGDFPSVLPMLQTFGGRSEYLRQGCAATLIASNWAITAAHCVVEDGATLPNDYWSVLPGATTLSTDDTFDRSDEVEVVTIYAHPEYDPTRFLNDIALMELAEDVDQPTVSLYSGTSASLTQEDAFLVGWGASDVSDPNNPQYPSRQQVVSVPIVSNATCNAATSYAGNIAESQLCAGFLEGGSDACQGDSGGPMLIGVDGAQVQVGIVSFGNGCALPNFYGVYTNVSSYRAWISNFVDVDFVPADPFADDQGQSGKEPALIPTLDSEGGGGAALWWLMLGTAGVAGRWAARRRTA